jgi:phosphate-selective porin OprO/OprP
VSLATPILAHSPRFRRRRAALLATASAYAILGFVSLAAIADGAPSTLWQPPAQSQPITPIGQTSAQEVPLIGPPPTLQLSQAPAGSTAESLPPPQTGSAPPPAKPPESDMDAILRRLDALEKSVAKPAEKAEKKEEKKIEPQWIDMSAEKWTVRLGGHMQLDSVNWAHKQDPPVPAFNYFEFRRLRLLADGVGYGVYDFRLQFDFEPENGEGTDRPVVDVKDAYFSMNELPYCLHRARIGNFFVPFSLEQVTNDTNNIFLERSIPTSNIFAADREVGVAQYGINDAQNFTWTFGTFIDSLSESLKERQDDNQGQRISGRLTYLPYYDEPSNGRYLIHTGMGLLYTKDQDGLHRFRARPQIHEGPFLIDTGVLPIGEYTTGNIEFATVCGPFSVQSEAFLSSVNQIAGDTEWVGGAYVYCSYFLTGENRVYERFGQHGAQFGRNVPYSNFFWVPGCCGPGAWELKARWSNLTLNRLEAGEYNDLTLGCNWYWTDRTRIMFDYIHPVTSGGSKPFGPTDSDIIGMRFDYNF